MFEKQAQIKSRMLKNAAHAWGYSDAEAENNFDPLVAMLLGACSVELEKISGEVHASRARILERLVQLLSPDVLTGPLPAHAIVQVQPADNMVLLTPTSQFYISQKLSVPGDPDKTLLKDIFFSPTGNFHLHQAAIRYMATGNHLYGLQQAPGKEMAGTAKPGQSLPDNTLWLGIEAAQNTRLHEAVFYFDFQNEANRLIFYHHLPKAKWSYQGTKLDTTIGYGASVANEEYLDIDSILNRDYDLSGKIKKQVNEIYRPFFITLLDEKEIINKDKLADTLPPAIARVFDRQDWQASQGRVLKWVCIQFPESIHSGLLQELVCRMNCFPVINCRLHDLHYRLQEMLNIIPLQTEDLFFDIHEITDQDGRVLSVRSFQRDSNPSVVLLLRNGAIGRFDQRDAAALTEQLCQLLRDESAAFSILGNEFMASEIKQLQQILNKLEQRLLTRQLHGDQVPYLVIRNEKKQTRNTLFVKYWSTNGEEGNGIKAGTPLQLYKSQDVDTGRLLLITTTRGGRNRLGTTDTLLAYKSALLSKDRLITTEDIKAFCHYQLGSGVKYIEVKKGVMIQPASNGGFSKTMDIFIEMHKKAYQEAAEKGELNFWQENMKEMIEKRSATLLPFRVFIQQAN